MTPDNPFLQALIADPDDDTLRLAMADWFEENNDSPRAEFIRLQIELANGVTNRKRRLELEVQQSKLLITHDAEWVAPLAKVLQCGPRWGGWVFRRGFVEYFRLSTNALLAWGSQLARLTPFRELNLSDNPASASIAIVFLQPWVQCLTHLYSVHLDERVATAMVDSPYLTNLRYLNTHPSTISPGIHHKFRKKFAAALCAGAS